MKQTKFFRKLMQVGRDSNTSYQITLPIDWIRDNNVAPGDILEVEIMQDHSLGVRIVKPPQEGPKQQ